MQEHEKDIPQVYENKNEFPKNIIGIIKTNNANELIGINLAIEAFTNPMADDNFSTINL